MTKIVCLVLLLAVVICSIFGWSCNQLNNNLVSFSNIVIKIQDEAVGLVRNLFPGFEDHFLSGDFVDTGNNIYSDNDDYNFIDYSHSDCIIYIVNSNLGIVDNASNKVLIKPNIYTVDIMTNGEYYSCYAMCYLFSDTVYYVIINAPDAASHLVNNYFIQGLFGTCVFYSPYSIRLYRNLTKTELTLSDISHDCQIKTEE